MYLRSLLTVASLTVATVAVLIVECWSTVINFSTSDPLGVCSTMISFGIDYGLGTGVGLGLLATLALIGTWVPAARPETMRRRLEPPVASLKHNLDRLAAFGIQTREVDDSIPSDVHMARLTRRMEAIEHAVASSSPSRETTHRWMRLLREANDLHNAGSLETRHFSEINTRGLNLFSIPDESDEMSGATSG